MNKFILTFYMLSICFSLLAQSPDAAKRANLRLAEKELTKESTIDLTDFGNTITSEDIKGHLTILASDEFEGRETGQPGNIKAANYIANHFKKLGLPTIGEKNTYFQHVAFSWSMWEDVSMNVNNERYRHLWDFICFPTRNSNLPITETSEIIFLGYGIDDKNYSDYKGVDVKGKVVLIFKGEPKNGDDVSYITGNKEESEWTTDWTKKLKAGYKNGARLILFIENEIQSSLSKNRNLLMGPRITLGENENPATNFANSCYISTNIAKALMGKKFKKVVKARNKIQKKGKPQHVVVGTNFKMIQKKDEKKLEGENILGFIEGSDEKLKDELLIITAHYDHLGRRGDEIYNGADDNGSGTSTVLEIAEAFVKAKEAGHGPRRSVLAMLVTGEEKGLLGSKYYTEKPVFPLENTIANINVDMVGRVDEKYKDNPNYIYVIGSNRLSTELHNINEKANEDYTKLTLDYTYNAEDDPNRYYYRSDHYNFAEKGIPAIFYFNGTHADYHRTSDTIEKINFDKMETIGRLIFYTAWDLANRDKRIEVDVIQKD